MLPDFATGELKRGFQAGRQPRIPKKWYTKVTLVLVAIVEILITIGSLPSFSKPVGIGLVVVSILVSMYLFKLVIESFVVKRKKNG